MTIENSHKGEKYSYITIDYQFILQLIFCKIALSTNNRLHAIWHEVY